jgi:hypothetical protein
MSHFERISGVKKQDDEDRKERDQRQVHPGGKS